MKTLARLLTISLTVFGSLLGECVAPAAVLVAGPPNNAPRTLKPKGKLNVFFEVTYTCANDPAKGTGHEGYRYTGTVNHAGLNGLADTHPADDVCPRPPLPGGVDPVDGSKDKGRGNKDKITKQVGADVLTDVFLKQ